MEAKKDIGAVVKNRLDHFKDSPDDLVWTTIEVELKRKKKKRVFVFWMSGIGLVALVLMFWMINPLSYSTEDNNTKPEFNTVDTNKLNTQRNTATDYEDDTSVHTNVTENEQLDNNTVTSKLTNDVQDKVNQNTQSKSATYQSSIANSTKTTKQNITQHIKIDTPEHNNTSVSSKNSENSFNTKIAAEHTINKDISISEEKRLEKSKQLSDREKAIIKRDSLIVINKKRRDSLKLEQKSKLVSEEKSNDSIHLDDESRWTIMPQATLSYYGALNTKTTDNFSFNYGVLASYRMTKETYLRTGIRRLKLNQTIDIDGTERIVEYLEFPLEIKYSPKQHKVNPYIIGGLSYFKLDKNSNNNAINFEYKATMSLNLGLGLETKLMKDIYFSAESIFNYQLKPFSKKNSVEPFIFSIHTGIEYRF